MQTIHFRLDSFRTQLYISSSLFHCHSKQIHTHINCIAHIPMRWFDFCFWFVLCMRFFLSFLLSSLLSLSFVSKICVLLAKCISFCFISFRFVVLNNNSFTCKTINAVVVWQHLGHWSNDISRAKQINSSTKKFKSKKTRDDQPTKTKCERQAKIPMKDGTAASAAAKRSATKKMQFTSEEKKNGLHRMLYRY